MALDSRFIIASDLQSLFRNKDTGLPLRNGVIYFWSDNSRSVPKDVYKLSGSPPNYDHVSIGSTVTLTAAGTMSDNENPANDIILYYFPYDGTPEESNGNLELYYVEVYSAGGKTSGVLQFTREAWPNFVTDEANADNLVNYIPNGQFKIHTNIPAEPDATPPLVAGEIRQDVTVLAQGGWTFERTHNTNAKDIVLFQSFGGYTDQVSASPEFFIQIQNQSPDAGDNRKDLCIQFDDVNKFASLTQTYTYAFAGKSNSGNMSASLILIKNYGDEGASPSEEIAIDNFVISNNYEVHQTNKLVFPTNSGKTITAGNNIKLALRLPLDSLFSVSLTDFIFTPGSQAITEFPQTTDSEFAYETITPAIPNYNSQDLYLPVVLTPQGLGYSHADVGKIFACMYETPNIGELLCDGSQYETDAYDSDDGIPYSRLQAVLYNTTTNIPRFGTGANYFTAYTSAVDALLRIATNKTGSATDASDGTVATGFDITTIHTGDIYGFNAYVFDSAKLFLVNTLPGITANPTNGSSPFTTQLIRQGSGLNQIVEVSVTAAAALSGLWFGVDSTLDSFYVWFKVDGVGTDPAPASRTGIEIDLNSGNTAQDVAEIIAEALMGQQLTTVATVAGSAVVAGSYFNISTATPVDYYVWYTKDGTGTDPKPPGKTSIGPVAITTAMTANQVALETQKIINQKFFAVPDLRGVFLRGWENTANIDPSVNFRGSTVNSTLYGDQIGTYQFDDFMSHRHLSQSGSQFYVAKSGAFSTFTGNDVGVDDGTSYNGGPETRPVNVYVNYVIKY
jgi:hypothetical protein